MPNYLTILNLLGASDTASDVETVAKSAFTTFQGIINVVFPIFIAVILLVGLFFGVQLGIKYAKAEEEEDKKKAKGQLINVIIGVLVAVIFVAIVEIILNQGFIEKLFPAASASGI